MNPALIVFHIQDAAAQPIPGALVQGDGRDHGHWQGLTCDHGDFIAQLSPDHYDLSVSAPGYTTRDLPADLADPGIITIGLESSVPPFRPAPRFWRGNMCGTRINGLPAVPGGAADPSLVLSWFYDRYDPTWRQIIRNEWMEQGYRHVLLSWPDSRAFGQSPQQFGATCAELVREGFYPCVMMCAKGIDPPDVTAIEQQMAIVLPWLVGVVPLFCVGWELSLWLNPTQVQTLIDWLAPLVTPSGARLGVHFQQGYGSFQQDGKFFADFWNPNVGKLSFLLHQKILSQTPEAYRGESGGLTDILERFAGGFGVSPDSGFGHPFDLVAFEITAMTQFEGSTTEAQGNALGQWAIDTPAVNGVRVMGSGNGAM